MIRAAGLGDLDALLRGDALDLVHVVVVDAGLGHPRAAALLRDDVPRPLAHDVTARSVVAHLATPPLCGSFPTPLSVGKKHST